MKLENFAGFGGHSEQCSISNGPPTSLPRHGPPKGGRYDLVMHLKGYFTM